MAGNSFGRILRLTSYGESHGPGLGGVLDGCPAGLPLSEEDLQHELDLRKPGQGATATKRKESDTVRMGVFQGKQHLQIITVKSPVKDYQLVYQ